MSDIYDELFEFFDIFGENSNKKFIPLDHSTVDYKFYNNAEDYGIFVLSDFKTEYRESCSGIIFESQVLNINNVTIKGYLLNCTVNGVQSEFARVCDSLINSDRVKLAQKPSDWFDRWKEAFGNANIVHNAYPIIGELIVLNELRKHGYSGAIWNGPNSGVCDIVDPESGMYFEVKSTLVRNSSVVTLSEEFQSKKSDYLCFCRFEEDPNGRYSIESIVKELVDSGYDKKSLDIGLRKLGIKNTSIRTMCYDLLELSYYPVVGNIPNIIDSLIDGVKPAHIEKISYSVNLSGLLFQMDVPVKPNTRNE